MADAFPVRGDGRLIFALDIGTRSVIGVAGRVEGPLLKVLKVDAQEHSERAVVDGQIENIEQTARIAGQVKERMEQELGFPFKDVYVAAAGRVLKTRRAVCEIELDDKQPVDQRQLSRLESRALQQAYEELLGDSDGDLLSYYCVGHSVIRYTLDGYTFSTLLGHRGRKATVELIGTFLPGEVVESLYATMSKIGLSIASVTLEPIAAINAVIPQELRLLNVALVDVGAGTSDIAIANGGSVCAYTMATVAGDEITESVMRTLLVDFQVAEEIKRQASEGRQTITYCDILGFENSIPCDELLEKIHPAVEELAGETSRRILDPPGGPPPAVFMVGGGSRTPGLCRLVAQGLGVDEKKVAIGGNNYMKRMVDTEPQYVSAEYATPIGIAITAMTASGKEELSVVLNGERVRMLGAGSSNVLEALLRGGYQYSQIMGRSGRNATFALDGERQIVRGGMPTLAAFEVNGRPANITTPLQPGDEIKFTPAVNGEDAAPLLRDILGGWEAFEVLLDGEPCPAGVSALCGGEALTGDSVIHDSDVIETCRVFTLADLFETQGIIPDLALLTVNGEPCEHPETYRLRPGDDIQLLGGASAIPEPAPAHRQVPAGQPVAPEPEPPVARRGPVQIILNGEPCELPPKPDGSPVQFFDVLNFVEIDPSRPQGDLVVSRNGRPASYIEPVLTGDQIEVYWKR